MIPNILVMHILFSLVDLPNLFYNLTPYKLFEGTRQHDWLLNITSQTHE